MAKKSYVLIFCKNRFIWSSGL